MSVNLIIAVTDNKWFEYLSRRAGLDEVNFWTPSEKRFRALRPGELFLFKLHSPLNFIVGGGIFAHETLMPCSTAWDFFGEANGAESFHEMRAMITEHRTKYPREPLDKQNDFLIGCRILTQPFFLPEDRWIQVPRSWSPSIVRFKRYSTEDSEGLELWKKLSRELAIVHPDEKAPAERLGKPRIIRPRLGQGAFRSEVVDAYGRRCAVTRERTLPALDAAHIRPYSEGGEHEISNGLLLRRDIHSLFDRGYVTVTPDLRFEVSKKIREQFENGRHYYGLHGSKVHVPEKSLSIPEPGILEWHNENRFLG